MYPLSVSSPSLTCRNYSSPDSDFSSICPPEPSSAVAWWFWSVKAPTSISLLGDWQWIWSVVSRLPKLLHLSSSTFPPSVSRLARRLWAAYDSAMAVSKLLNPQRWFLFSFSIYVNRLELVVFALTLFNPQRWFWSVWMLFDEVDVIICRSMILLFILILILF